jgi:hypothetical protein
VQEHARGSVSLHVLYLGDLPPRECSIKSFDEILPLIIQVLSPARGV